MKLSKNIILIIIGIASFGALTMIQSAGHGTWLGGWHLIMPGNRGPDLATVTAATTKALTPPPVLGTIGIGSSGA
jgi:hypothetical protein